MKGFHVLVATQVFVWHTHLVSCKMARKNTFDGCDCHNVFPDHSINYVETAVGPAMTNLPCPLTSRRPDDHSQPLSERSLTLVHVLRFRQLAFHVTFQFINV
ncbi:hypothetical protein O6P43_022357 [Quillaja saponaria]|uniref:Secreted protein n=1 Tax=Quillaja saponaria TaxID=32244 RepID=A0AAD7PI66_QUISA|nr:hypothetical protein O6P43_022357 [Quillaja saponaria]